jgi:hypothetical protein
MTTVEMDVLLRKPDEADGPEQTFLPSNPKISADEHRKSARRYFIGIVIAGLLSFIFFVTGLGSGVSVAARLYLL